MFRKAQDGRDAKRRRRRYGYERTFASHNNIITTELVSYLITTMNEYDLKFNDGKNYDCTTA